MQAPPSSTSSRLWHETPDDAPTWSGRSHALGRRLIGGHFVRVWLVQGEKPLGYWCVVMEGVEAKMVLRCERRMDIAVAGQEHRQPRMCAGRVFWQEALGLSPDLTSATSVPYEVRVQGPLEASA